MPGGIGSIGISEAWLPTTGSAGNVLTLNSSSDLTNFSWQPPSGGSSGPGANAFTATAYSASYQPASGVSAITRLGFTLTGNIVITTPSGSPGDGDVIQFAFLASGGARTVNLSAFVSPSYTGITFPFSIPTGLEWYAAIRYSSRKSAWQLIQFVGGF